MALICFWFQLPLWQHSRSRYWFVLLVTSGENEKSRWKVKNWKWKTNQLCHLKEAGTKGGWILRGEMIYHGKIQIRAKAGFHVSLGAYDGMMYTVPMKCICLHSLGIEKVQCLCTMYTVHSPIAWYFESSFHSAVFPLDLNIFKKSVHTQKSSRTS